LWPGLPGCQQQGQARAAGAAVIKQGLERLAAHYASGSKKSSTPTFANGSITLCFFHRLVERLHN
jgi:hypothetical protein